MTTLNAFFLSTSCRTAPPVRRGASRVRPSACWRVAMDGPCAPPREQKAARFPPRTPTQPGWRVLGDQRKDPESITMELGRPWGATQCYPCPAPTPASQAADANSASSSARQRRTPGRTQHAHARKQLLATCLDVAFLTLAQRVSAAVWSAAFPVTEVWGQAPASAGGGQTGRGWPLTLLSSPAAWHSTPEY